MRTFIGELIFRFKDDASGKAKQTAQAVGGAVSSIEQAARRLNSMPFGGRFTAQLDKLGASASDLDKVRAAWERLHSSMASRNLSKAAAKSEIENFKVATLGHFAAIQNASNAHFREMEKRTRSFSSNLQMIMKPALVAMGGYTGAYMVGVGARAGITASSNEQRERARQHFAGLPVGEQQQIEKQSGELAQRFRIAQADAMEIMREARLAMPSAEAAFGVAEEMVQAYKMLGLSFGSDQAITGLRAFNKAMDNINVTEDTGLYKQMLDAFVRAQQITGKDMDPEAFAQAVKYARTSGKVFSPDFLQNMLPFLIAESGGSDTGTQLRATFDNFVGGTATKSALGEQGRLGLRDQNGIKDAEGFAQDPLKWVNDNIVPALQKDGVDLNSEVAIAQAVQKFASNRLARDFIQRAITQRDVYLRLSGMMQGAIGLEGASSVDALDPFSAFKGFKDSMSNLAAAILPAEQIAAGLNTLADGINALQRSWRDGDTATRLGIGAAGAGAAFGAWKVTAAIWGLMTAGTNLNAAAVALQVAAANLNGGSGANVANGGKGKGSALGGWAALVGRIAGVAGLGTLLSGSSGPVDPKARDNMLRRDFEEWVKTHPFIPDRKAIQEQPAIPYGSLVRDPGAHGDRLANYPGVDAAKHAGQQIQDSLNVTAKPNVDRSDLEATLALINQIKSGLGGIGAAMSGAAQRARQQADAEVRRSFSDYGVAP
ncbi:hypothetical protein ASE36_00110 [Rhizobium sp. Root274]|uniref:hypothetical protein n=1 Tax=unclassified Rhizobium TaxID=2613769 RepID=UPI0007158DC6|nr:MULTISPECIES: hypothetical protein [unclassified Rhizobium]KQW30743.1 hypothetical protein ASC71_00110 [Rhizobium sp. Root1240]KRD32290.1 hypothetical protein ASE36_00110 [Rhizobium sp. Root274]